MSNEYEKKNEPTPGQKPGPKDDKSVGGRQGQTPQGEPREEERENWREGQGGSQRKPSSGQPGATESE